jgi:hypothetical protein
MGFVAGVGRAFLAFLEATGRVSLFAGTAVSHCVRPPFYFRLIGQQMVEIGYYSLPVVGMTALFTGMVLALQSYTGFARFSAEGLFSLCRLGLRPPRGLDWLLRQAGARRHAPGMARVPRHETRRRTRH